MIKAVIFDMDGIIVDSEPIESLALEKILLEYGHKPIFNDNGLIHIPGLIGKQYWKLLEDRYPFKVSRDVIRDKKRKIFGKIVQQGIVPMPGVLQLLDELKRKKIKLAVASSRFSKQVLLMIESLKLKNYFYSIICPDKNIRPKPFPDLFLESVKILEVSPTDCIVLEDTETGVEAAKKAGVKVIAIPNKYTLDQNFSKANLVVKSLSAVTLTTLENL